MITVTDNGWIKTSERAPKRLQRTLFLWVDKETKEGFHIDTGWWNFCGDLVGYWTRTKESPHREPDYWMSIDLPTEVLELENKPHDVSYEPILGGSMLEDQAPKEIPWTA